MVTDPIKFVYKVGDGVTTDFSYAYNGAVGFDADVAEDVRAAILNPDGTRDTNPNFAVLKDTYGNFTGAIRFATAPVANAVVYIYRATPQTQETEYKTSSGFDAKNVENDFDKLTKLVQETSSHARNKTVQLDMFQENVLKFILASEANQNQMLFFDFSTLTFRFTSFTKGQAVISSASASDDKTDIMLTHLTDEGTGLPYLAFSLDQGATWKPMNFAEISAIVNSANAKAQEALDNSETAVSVAAAAKAVADGIDAKAQEALDNSETAVSVANDAKAVADGIDAKINEVQGDVDTLNAKVPSNASASNKMATAAEISNLQTQITSNDTDIANLQSTKADKATTLAGYGITNAYTKTEVDAKVSSVYRFRGSVATYSDLPTTGQVIGDVWNVEDTGANYAWSGTEWDKLSETVDLTPYLTKAEASSTYATQSALAEVSTVAETAQSTADKADSAAEVAQQTANVAGTTAAQALSGLNSKVDKAQGTANAGKILGIGDDGNVVPIDGASGASGTGRNVGDIFWTTRTDSALNGAVEANGAQYNFADVNQGQNNVQALLVSGALPSVSIAEFDAKVASDGGCDSFGYDSSATYFKVPKKTPRILVRCQKPTADNNYTWFNLYSDGWCEQGGIQSGNTTITNGLEGNLGTISLPIEMLDTNYVAISQCEGSYCIPMRTEKTNTTTKFVFGAYSTNQTLSKISWQVSGYAAASEYTKDKWDYQNVQVERPMVQLFNDATDEALATCTEVLADVAGLKQTTDGMIDYVVESQEPTSANGYTWYRKYKSGWVEQGGYVSASGDSEVSTTYPIELQDPVCPDVNLVYEFQTDIFVKIQQVVSMTTTGFTTRGKAVNNTSKVWENGNFYWKVFGMSAQGSN